MTNIKKDEIARLTEEYGGQWGINHTQRLLLVHDDASLLKRMSK